MSLSDTHYLVENFLKPYLLKSFPDLSAAFLLGSYGRALKNGLDQPVSSSDIDLVVIFNDMADAGFDCSVHKFKYEDIGKALGGPSDIKMLDMNLHDPDSLALDARYIREDEKHDHLVHMISQGVVLFDRDGLAQPLQKHAQMILNAGPLPFRPEEAKEKLENLKSLRDALAAAPTKREARGIGLLSYTDLGVFHLGINEKWQTGISHINRYYRDLLPNEKARFDTAMSELILKGKKGAALALFDDIIEAGRKTLPDLKERPYYFDVNAKNVLPQQRARDIDKKFTRFVIEHCATSIDTAHERGEDYYIDAIAGLTRAVAKSFPDVAGIPAGTPQEKLAGLEKTGLMGALLNSMDQDDHQALAVCCDQYLAPIGGMYYEDLLLEYKDDLAYRRSQEKKGPGPGSKKRPGGSSPSP